MSLKFAKVSGFYSGFLKKYYADYSADCENWSWNKQYQHLTAQGFGWSDYLCRHLEGKSINAHEIISNAVPLQKAWAQEHGTSASGRELVLRQLKEIQPDVVFMQSTAEFDARWCQELRAEIPQIKLIMGWRCSPFSDEDLQGFRSYDIMLTCNPRLKQEFKSAGISAELLHHAFEPGNLKLINEMRPSPWAQTLSGSVAFAGSLIQAKEFHNKRLSFLAELDRAGVPLVLFTEKNSQSKAAIKKVLGVTAQSAWQLGLLRPLKNKALVERVRAWRNVSVTSSLSSGFGGKIYPALYGLEMFKAMSESAVSLNFHIDSSGDYAGNARLFEATGVGSCLVTDHKLNLGELFEIDKEVIAYQSFEECIDKLRWLEKNPIEREKIARAGQERCFKDHTFERRADQLLEVIRERLN